MSLTNMQLSAEEAKSETGCCPSTDASGPRYPYGLTVYLDDEALKKLGITVLPDVGTVMNLAATVEVTSNSQRQTQDGKTVNMDLQITAMDLAPQQAAPTAATVLYGG